MTNKYFIFIDEKGSFSYNKWLRSSVGGWICKSEDIKKIEQLIRSCVDRFNKYLAKKNRTTPSNNIKDLRPGMTKVNIKAEILEIAEPKRVVTRYGNNASIVKVLIGDETGTIKLCLWNEQIDNVTKGDIVQIENAQASAFRGERQLALGKKGTLTTLDSASES